MQMLSIRRWSVNTGLINTLSSTYHRNRRQWRAVFPAPCPLSSLAAQDPVEPAQISHIPQVDFPQAYLAIPPKDTHGHHKDYGQTLGVQHHCAPTETLAERRQRWSTLLRQQHYQPVISEVLDEELPKHTNSAIIDSTDRISHMRECALILASAPLVFAAAVDGSLIRRLSSDTDLQKEYAVIQEQAHDQPSIYIHFLADENGVAPTPNQYLQIRDVVQDYMAQGQQSTHAWHLDNITLPTVSIAVSAQGHRKYLHTSNRSSIRVDTLRRFCDGVQARVSETPTLLRDTPFSFPPGECGYSRNSHIRLLQHRARQSSNYVMNLVEDICTYLHRTRRSQQHFRMHQYIIYLIFRPAQAAIAEIFCSGLLQVWVENGGGFNAYPAGRSVATARRVSLEKWSAHETWVRQQSPVDANMRLQQERAEVWNKALEWKPPVVAEDEEMAETSATENTNDRYECA